MRCPEKMGKGPRCGRFFAFLPFARLAETLRFEDRADSAAHALLWSSRIALVLSTRRRADRVEAAPC